MIDAEELGAWLRLLHTPGVGRDSARRLLAALGSPQAVFEAPRAACRELVGPALASALGAPASQAMEELVTRTRAWLAAGPERHIVSLGDAAYPQALLRIEDPPLLFYAQGRVDLLQGTCLAIVGSRNPTAQGADNARAFASDLSGAGLTIVSGLALGIDGAAHAGALLGAGSTVAVLGTGIDRVYPARHRQLAHQISEQGVLVSEFSVGTAPLRENFPQRNRLIAGLGVGTLVVEAALQSGSLITARLAAEAGREVFAIPGSIHAPQSRGCHALIKQGAKLVESVDDVLSELGPALARKAVVPSHLPGAVSPDASPDPVLRALGHDPTSMDALVARTGWPTELLNARLLELELDDLVQRLPGGLFQRRGAT